VVQICVQKDAFGATCIFFVILGMCEYSENSENLNSLSIIHCLLDTFQVDIAIAFHVVVRTLRIFAINAIKLFCALQFKRSQYF
jgi:hypothetical protein